MRIHISTTKNTSLVPFNYQQKLVGTIHKWIGENSIHDRISLYSFSWLQGGRKVSDALDFPEGATLFLGFYDDAIEVLDKAVARYGAPEIINSDQGVQCTCEDWHRACNGYGMRISMDGRARCLDNVWIERFWRTIKREYVYLNPESTVGGLRRGITKYIDYYNNRRCHQGLDHQTPCAVYAAVAA